MKLTSTGQQPAQSRKEEDVAHEDWDNEDDDAESLEDGEEELEEEEKEEDGAEVPEAPEPDFYDPTLDERDEAWMSRQRGGRKSDAILSCPGCLTTICLDCQQHHELEGQFRAMFCVNVRVDKGRTVSSRAVSQRRGKRRRGQAQNTTHASTGAVENAFYPVECTLCDTHLGVQDTDEVFHLYHIVASNA